MTNEVESDLTKEREKMSDQTLKHISNAVFTVLLVNAGILLLAGIFYYTSVDISPAYPLYQQFVIWIIFPIMLVGAITWGEMTSRKIEKRADQKKAEAKRIQEIKDAVRKKEEEEFMKLPPDEKWRRLLQEFRNK